ncbi:hypothetical protein QTL97_04235 [Sporosarcina thermotolerans]|uniref:Uncharacterized protein n=1 Tax=Sporosarcina thermotolerans TaxID=633404 RepID=A0AAW9A4U9_9BACL|nr:hypothetical protein [Sporosarcina thermotolerans]MDW0116132.1 hypothetical protein [Sporosarcina thermotolerans]WHT48102.1 hypothetical protein QNH10_19060 [Sporosarcina thermotolerans]
MIKEMLDMYIEPATEDIHHRYNSWHHCHSFFANNHQRLHEEFVQDVAALHIGFYLASWGMMRGSSKLIQKDYKIHLEFVRTVAGNTNYTAFYSRQLTDEEHVETLMELVNETRACYEEFNVSDTLVTKILMGVFGNIPAFDRYFRKGLRLHSMKSSLTKESLIEIVRFYNTYKMEFEPYLDSGFTPMKLIDMYFWQSAIFNKQASKIIATELASLNDEDDKVSLVHS